MADDFQRSRDAELHRSGTRTRVAYGDRSSIARSTLEGTLGPLHGLIDDPSITEIVVNGSQRIFVERDGQIMPAVSSHELLRVGDRLVFAGIIDSVMDLHRLRGLVQAPDALAHELSRCRRDHLEHVVPEQLVAPLGAKQAQHRRIDEDDAPLRMHEDGVRRDLDQLAVAQLRALEAPRLASSTRRSSRPARLLSFASSARPRARR